MQAKVVAPGLVQLSASSAPVAMPVTQPTVGEAPAAQSHPAATANRQPAVKVTPQRAARASRRCTEAQAAGGVSPQAAGRVTRQSKRTVLSSVRPTTKQNDARPSKPSLAASSPATRASHKRKHGTAQN